MCVLQAREAQKNFPVASNVVPGSCTFIGNQPVWRRRDFGRLAADGRPACVALVSRVVRRAAYVVGDAFAERRRRATPP